MTTYWGITEIMYTHTTNQHLQQQGAPNQLAHTLII